MLCKNLNYIDYLLLDMIKDVQQREIEYSIIYKNTTSDKGMFMARFGNGYSIVIFADYV